MTSELHTMQKIQAEFEQHVYASPEHTQLVMASLALQGAVTLEYSKPGTGKTLAVRTLAQTIDGTFGRIQGDNTKDASDIIGNTLFDQATSRLKFNEGPIFKNVVLLDEAPRFNDLDGLLQPAEEGTVTIEALNEVRDLPAVRSLHLTGNPLATGREKLDLATRDRIWMQLPTDEQTDVSYRSKLGIAFGKKRPIEQVAEIGDIENVYKAVNEGIQVTGRNMDDAVALWRTVMDKGRDAQAFDESQITLDDSTRPLIHLLRTAQATTFLKGERSITALELARLAGPVLAHRVAFNRNYRQENPEMTPADLVADAAQDFLKSRVG